MDEWKKSFSDKLAQVQSRWAARFDQALDTAAMPVFEDLTEFLRKQGIAARVPLNESGRRSLKFELAEDAYLLLIFRSTSVGEFELSREIFVLGSKPEVRRTTERLTTLTEEWARDEFQLALDLFADRLSEADAPVEPEPATV